MKIFCNKEEYFRSQTVDNLKNQIWLKGEWVLSGDNSRSRMEYSKQKDFSEETHGQMINTLKDIISKRESDKIIVGKPVKDDNAQDDNAQDDNTQVVHAQPEKVQNEGHSSESVHAEDIGSERIQPEITGVENFQVDNELKEQNNAENELKIDDESGNENELEIKPEIVDKPDQETPNQPEIETKDQVMNDDNEYKELISKIIKFNQK
jgi:RNase H-fold protein (predicted Holliday junction resolvase)